MLEVRQGFGCYWNQGYSEISIESRDDQVVVRSLRDFSIIYSVGEILSNTVKHFNKCCTSGWNPSQLGLGLPGLESGLGDKDDEGKVGGVLGEVEADSDEEEMTHVQMSAVSLVLSLDISSVQGISPNQEVSSNQGSWTCTEDGHGLHKCDHGTFVEILSRFRD